MLAHHVMRAEPDTLVLAPTTSRRDAMTLRSNTMGVLIEHDDYGLAERYERLVGESPVLRAVEDWAFPTYTREAQPESGFALPRSLLLRNTAAEVIRELGSYGGARRAARRPRCGGRLRRPGRQGSSELAFDSRKKRRNYTNPGLGSRPGNLITAEPPGEAASHKTRCA